MIYVAGVDGCPGGWIVVLHPIHRPKAAELRLVMRFQDVLDLTPAPTIIAVDIPIGLPDHVGIGGRKADIEARRVLGARQSAVFAIPSRAAVMCDDYRTACAIAFQTSDPPRKVSKQAFNLFSKIRDVDAVVTPSLQDRVFEVHPEVAFWSLNARAPLDTPKKVRSRPNPEGLAARRALLERDGYPAQLLTSRPFAARDVGPDDILDACANASAAVRIHNGTAVRFPDVPDVDGRGLRMEIWG